MTWSLISCADREEFFGAHGADLAPVASRTDLGGGYGQATMFTEWGWRDTGAPVLRDQRWPDPRNPDRDMYAHPMPYPDVQPCEHWIDATERR